MGRRRTYIGLKVWDMGFDAHLTVHYYGNKQVVPEVVMDMVAMNSDRFFYAKRNRIEMFGQMNNVPALTVEVCDDLKKLQQAIAAELPSSSPFTWWNPHITLKLQEAKGLIRLPERIMMSDLGFYC